MNAGRGDTDTVGIIVDDDLLEAASISDTKVSISAGFASFPCHTFPNTPPVVLVSQLYSSVKNRTDVDRELDNLKRDGVVHIFKLLSGKNDYAIISREDYIKSIKKLAQEHKDSIFEIHKTKLLEMLFGHDTNSTISMDFQKDAALTTLVNANLLLVHEVNHFWFCIPNVGLFIASLVKGRKEIISILQKQRFKELLLLDLQKKKLRYSFLTIEFLIRDMNGLNIIERILTTNGYLIRLKDVTW